MTLWPRRAMHYQTLHSIMAEPTLNYLPCQGAGLAHRMAYWQWGSAQAAHTVVCVHGLTRQGRDFDILAQALIARAQHPLRVVCPDVVGRGNSDWLADPLAYQIATYVTDLLTLIAHLQVTTLDWVGTSMGGLIGMGVCAQLGRGAPGTFADTQGPRIRKLVLNDVGPVIERDAIARITQFLGRNMEFASLQDAAQAQVVVSASFGPHTPAQWLALTQHMVKPRNDGGTGVRLHYDPAIAVPIAATTPEQAAMGEALLWQVFDAITAETMLLRGAASDLLAHATAVQMTQRGPRAQLVEFAGVGHAPTLIAHDQVDTVCRFLLE